MSSTLKRSRDDADQPARSQGPDEPRAKASTTSRGPVDLRVPAVLQRAVDEAARLLGATGAVLCVLDPETGGLKFAHESGSSRKHTRFWARSVEVNDGTGLIARAMSERRLMVTGDYVVDRSFTHSPGADRAVARLGYRSVLIAPLLIEDRAAGVLAAFSSRWEAFDENHAAVIGALADHAASAIANAQLIAELAGSREQLAQRVDEQRTLTEIAARLTSIRQPDELLQFAVNEATRLLEADGGLIDRVDEEGLIRWAFGARVTDAGARRILRGLELRVGQGLFGLAVAERRIAVTGDYGTDPRFEHAPGADAVVRRIGIRSLIAAPLIADNQALGVLGIYSGQPDFFDGSAVELMGLFADHASVAIANSRLIDELGSSQAELERRAEAERSLRDISARISALHDQSDVLQLTVDESARLVDADGAILELLDANDGLLHWSFDSGLRGKFDPGYVRGLTLPVGVGLTGRAVADGRVLVAGENLASEFPPSAESDEFFRTTGFESMIAAPVIGEVGATGAIEVYSTRPHAFGEADAELIGALATQAAIAITNARLIDELDRSRSQLAERVETERTLRAITERIAGIRDPDEVLQEIVDKAQRLLKTDGAHLTLLSDDGATLTPVVVAGTADEPTREWLQVQRFPLNGGMNGLAAGLGRPLWTADYLVDPRIPHEQDDQATADRLGLRGMAVAPLRAPEGDIAGTLAISWRTPHEVSEEEMDLLQVLADQAAIALAGARLDALLRESEARYRNLVENSPDLVWAIDADARFSFVSDTCERLTGWKPEELIGDHFGAIVHPSSSDVAQRDWTAQMAEGEHELRGRLDLLHRDGHAIPAEFLARTRIEGGRFVGANGSVRDMTERDELERQLRESEERYRFLVDNSPDVIFSIDAERHFTYLSDTIERIVGRRASELLGADFGSIIEERSLPEALAAWNRAAAEPTLAQTVPLTLTRSDGGTVPVEVNVVGVSEGGVFKGVQGVTRDISERDRLERELRKQAVALAASDERAHLARELHDSVTQALFSMTLITRSIEVLLGKDPSAATERIATLRELQRDALAEMRALIFELRPGSLEQDGLAQALRTHTAAVQGRIGLPVAFEADLPARLPLEVEEALYRIAQEALHNVVKHAGARQVRVAITTDATSVRLVIADDGAGFDEAIIPPGHLGLAGMRVRAEKIGAVLELRTRVGQGTTITVVAPAVARAESAGTIVRT